MPDLLEFLFGACLVFGDIGMMFVGGLVAFKDYYEVLGVARNASEEAIKKAVEKRTARCSGYTPWHSPPAKQYP